MAFPVRPLTTLLAIALVAPSAAPAALRTFASTMSLDGLGRLLDAVRDELGGALETELDTHLLEAQAAGDATGRAAALDVFEASARTNALSGGAALLAAAAATIVP